MTQYISIAVRKLMFLFRTTRRFISLNIALLLIACAPGEFSEYGKNSEKEETASPVTATVDTATSLSQSMSIAQAQQTNMSAPDEAPPPLQSESTGVASPEPSTEPAQIQSESTEVASPEASTAPAQIQPESTEVASPESTAVPAQTQPELTAGDSLDSTETPAPVPSEVAGSDSDNPETTAIEEPSLGAANSENSSNESNIPVDATENQNSPSEQATTEQPTESNGSSSENSFTLISISGSNITSSSFDVEWSLSELGTGQVHYGTGEALEQVSIEETRFRFDTHKQTISNLQPETTYKFYVRSVNSLGIEIRSSIEEITTSPGSITTEPVASTIPSNLEPVADWPLASNEDLPLAGIFYGQQEAGLLTGNASIALESSRRFRAEKTGFINAVRYNNRTLLSANITGRCKPSAPNSVWCKCVNAGLDKYSCGYTLGNSYSVGNGGSIIIEIRPNDETTDNTPAETVLGRTAGVFVPVQRANEHFPILDLENPVFLQAGKLYHLVYRNINPPIGCKLSGVSVSQAASCPRNKGAIGLNGTYQPVLYGKSAKYGPFGGNSAGNLVRNSSNSAWNVVQQKLSWYEVGYEDGTWIGDSHTGIGSTAEGRHFVGGNKVGRQVFTVRDSTRIVDGLWLYYGHNYTVTPDGSPLTVSLKDVNGLLLASGTIEASPECIATAAIGYNSGSFREQHCRVWEYTDFDKTVDLLEGETYSVEFSASSTSGISLHTFFPLNYGVWQSTSRNHWSDAHAEISFNNGASWEGWSRTYYPDRDINMLFTIQGMPKQLQ